ncbi:RNase A-like domain-containing protein [Komagataeibacter sp. FXV3]|uniref:RNase A-like domain-containing protein n=1 Tax=Komagataeibacter sp. FXV3 TaxID=2608998 RepID=UPI0031F88886
MERRFTKENRPVVSSFTAKEEAERAIHAVLRDNSHRIDAWIRNATDGATIQIEGHVLGKGTVVIQQADRERSTAQRIRVTIIKKEHNGMIYYVNTVKLYQ